MKTITRTYAVCTPAELKEHYPERFQKEFDKWSDASYYDWWEATYTDFAENTHMYTPAVCAYFKNYPPATWPTEEWPDELTQLVSAWTDVVNPTTGGERPIRGFDLCRGRIELGEFRLHVAKFLELTKFSWPEPLALEANIQRFGDHVVRIDTKEPLSTYYEASAATAEDFLHRVFGVPKPSINEGFSEDAEELGKQIEQCFEAIREAVRVFFKDLGKEVLRVLEAELDYLQSEECFLGSDHLEFEVELT